MKPPCCPPLTCTVLDEEQAGALAVRLKALADPVRLRLVSILACCEGGEVCACDLPELLERKQPTVSHHLKVLTEAGLIEREQRGKWAWFRLAPEGLTELRAALGGEVPSRELAHPGDGAGDDAEAATEDDPGRDVTAQVGATY